MNRSSRRAFLTKAITLGRWYVMWTLCPLAGGCGPRAGESQEGADGRMMQTLPLEDMVNQKRHHGDGRFINPFNSHLPGKFPDILKWKLFSKNHFSDQYTKEHVRPVVLDWAPVKAHQGLSVTYITHASIMIKDLDTYILVDPVFNGLSFFIKDFTPLKMDVADMPRPDHVLITHGHYDHLDMASLKAVHHHGHLITPLGYRDTLDGLFAGRATELDWLEDFSQGQRKITLLPCNHWTMRNPIVGPNRSLWGSYLIRTAAGPTIYVSGDTAYFEGFDAIGKLADIDLAIFSVGAYEPRWFMRSSHMNPADTVQAFKALGAKRMMVVHWGTFRLGDEPVFLPPVQMQEEMAAAGLADRLIHIQHGQTLFFDQPG
jgi:N-acyl-phosphatidylethanolamine-hydrolysing phospholipase D